MEMVEGETLEARLRHSGPLPPSLALEVITQAARALVALEVNGLVHRDLKPANLMLVERPELTVKMIDFGLAKAAATAESESDITHGCFVGNALFCQSGAIHKHQRRRRSFRLVFVGYHAVGNADRPDAIPWHTP